MSNNHSGNGMLNEITREEHDGQLYAKRVSMVSGTTIFAVVNTSSGGNVTVVIPSGATVFQGSQPWNSLGTSTMNGLVTLAPSPNFIGLVTLGGGFANLRGNVTLSNSQTYIGLVTATLGLGDRYIGLVTATSVGLQTLAPSPNFIGLATVNIGSSNATLFAVVNTAAAGQASVKIDGNVTLADAKTFIGLTTSVLGASPAFIGIVTIANPSSFTGNLTLDPGSRTGIVGNVTLSDAKTYIGLTTTTLGVGDRYIGLVTSTINGLVSLAPSPNFIGIVTITNKDRSIVGNLTLSNSKGFIGLVTSVPAYGSGSTVYTGVISASGNTTVLVAPASNRFFLKNLHISSLGRSEVEIRSGATTLIPFTSLSTTAGYFEHYGEMGLPARAQTDALVINLNGAATISYMANVRFEA